VTLDRRRIATGAGIGLGTILAAPAATQAEDISVTNLNDDGTGSLRQAIDDANSTSGADRVLFKSKLSGEIHLTTGALPIYNGNLDVRGPGARKLAIDADGDSRIFEALSMAAIDVTISDLTATGGYSSVSGAAIVAGGPVDLTVSDVAIRDNSTLSSGGGIAALDSAGSLTVADSTISGNSAGGNGGGIYPEYGATVRNSTISGNSASFDGGGVFVRYGPLSVANSTIAGNTAADDGGGILNLRAPVELDGTVVADNTAGDQGQDIFDDLGLYASSVGDHTLVEDPSGLEEDELSGSGNILGVDPKLKPLANNGGPTDTQAFKKSPVKNKVPKGQSEKKDQRGAPRKGKPDIGAYEFTKCEGVIVNRVGTAGKDKLKGTKRKDGILGLGGNDKLKGKKGKDGLCGGSGKDKLIGGPGKDKLNGGPGKDKEIQ
jgi:hypothetical protein